MGKHGWRWPDGTQVLDGPGHGPSELARAGLRTGPVTIRRALGEARDRRWLVPAADRFAARPGSAAAVRLGMASMDSPFEPTQVTLIEPYSL